MFTQNPSTWMVVWFKSNLLHTGKITSLMGFAARYPWLLLEVTLEAVFEVVKKVTFGSDVLDPSSALHHMYDLGLNNLVASVSSLFSLLVVIIFLVMVLCYGACHIGFSGQLPSTETTITSPQSSFHHLPYPILSSLNKCSAHLSTLSSPPLSLTVNSAIECEFSGFSYFLELQIHSSCIHIQPK